VTDLRDSAIWAATCDLRAQVLRNARRPVVVRFVVRGVVLVAAGLVAFAVMPAIVGGVLVVLGLVPVVLGLVVVRDPGHLMLEADGFTYRSLAGRVMSRRWQDCGGFRVVRSPLRTAGHVAWLSADGGPGGAFLPGTGSLPREDLAVLLNRYRQRFAPNGDGTA
jgi:hypothetical protein